MLKMEALIIIPVVYIVIGTAWGVNEYNYVENNQRPGWERLPSKTIGCVAGVIWPIHWYLKRKNKQP